ncbi:metallophosphoesterase family protein [Salirhabdus salicampi]|uniref:metallophosphoesterase family protein n=1 Tax=Salirhabdus salicampi TaxID=476102 RepID=UPI0020C1C64A|nr:metallophosphoesterase [Salirhabdus salicampi]MCP8617883.1 metallophosphoesterase [Salirhabdus salicampi]
MAEKVAIITDIHGNYNALKAVLHDINKDEDIVHIYCLGDLIGIGHETNEVLSLLSVQKNISFVAGNHDQAILNIFAGKEPGSKGEEKEHHKWIASRLDPAYLPMLSGLSQKLYANHNGKTFYFTHYHVNERGDFLPVDQTPSVNKLDELYRESTADIVCFGHHHVVHHFKSKERLYVNPSSLGCNHKPLAPYGVVELGAFGNINISFREVPYDNKDFLLSYERLNVPGKEFILEVFYGNQHLRYI